MTTESQPLRKNSPSTQPHPPTTRYLEIWGDIVVGRDLAISVCIGAGVSLTALLVSKSVFSSLVDNKSLAHAYPLLVGIAGCIIAGVVSGKLFRPKRIIAVEASEGDSIGEVIQELQEDRGGLGSVKDLPPQTVRELQDLGLYDRFVDAETQESAARAGTP